MSDEIWKEVVGFPGYEVSNLGNIRSYLYLRNRRIAQTPRPVKAGLDTDGYKQLSLSRDGIQYVRKVHRLVLDAFVGEKPNDQMVCAHGNGVRTDNRLENLRWATCLENHNDRRSHGSDFAGTRNPACKLKPEDVIAIRKDTRPLNQIAKDYGVHWGHIGHIKRGRVWKHIPMAASA